MTRKPTPRKPAPKKQRTAIATPAGTKRQRRTPARTPRVRPLVTAPPEHRFWVHYGPVLKDLRELREALQQHISEAQFRHHVGPHRNDFANWVEQVLDEVVCGRALRQAHTVDEALRAVDAALRDR